MKVDKFATQRDLICLPRELTVRDAGLPSQKLSNVKGENKR